jgi:hypothetical protein
MQVSSSISVTLLEAFDPPYTVSEYISTEQLLAQLVLPLLKVELVTRFWADTNTGNNRLAIINTIFDIEGFVFEGLGVVTVFILLGFVAHIKIIQSDAKM